MREIGLADEVRALKDLDCIAVQIKAHRPVRRIVYDNADWSAESRKLLRYSRDLRFEFRQFEPNSIERLIDRARASGTAFTGVERLLRVDFDLAVTHVAFLRLQSRPDDPAY
jgi:hypothetical protein